MSDVSTNYQLLKSFFDPSKYTHHGLDFLQEACSGHGSRIGYKYDKTCEKIKSHALYLLIKVRKQENKIVLRGVGVWLKSDYRSTWKSFFSPYSNMENSLIAWKYSHKKGEPTVDVQMYNSGQKESATIKKDELVESKYSLVTLLKDSPEGAKIYSPVKMGREGYLQKLFEDIKKEPMPQKVKEIVGTSFFEERENLTEQLRRKSLLLRNSTNNSSVQRNTPLSISWSTSLMLLIMGVVGFVIGRYGFPKIPKSARP